MLTVIALILMFIYMLELHRQLTQISDQVTQLHRDFIEEINTRHGEKIDGEK
mgnify:FL=1|tara:strand:- start:4007 stop:4162 length:156 start_codon:yes stop_codon:yes gene_type:complete